MLESMMLVAGAAVPRPRTGPRDEAMRLARTCYDHIAGRLGVGLADAMQGRGWIEADEEAGALTAAGSEALRVLRVEVVPGPSPRAAPFCRLCLDWSERRPHLAGRLGAALCAHGLDRGWIRRRAGSRALDVTPEGRRAWRDGFGVEL